VISPAAVGSRHSSFSGICSPIKAEVGKQPSWIKITCIWIKIYSLGIYLVVVLEQAIPHCRIKSYSRTNFSKQGNAAFFKRLFIP